MANPGHLKILKQGVEVWNRWRSKHREKMVPNLSSAHLNGANLIRVDLIRANLRGIRLSGALLRGADINGAYLNGADLSGADLSGAHLNSAHFDSSHLNSAQLSGAQLSSAHFNGAHLIRADLKSADLKSANFSDANLSDANLSDANLRGAIFRRSIVNGANFTNSGMSDTTLADIDLSEAKGLETVNHWYPSTIGIDTLYKSAGKIPEAFLRGCGVAESFIMQMHALIASAEPIQFYSCFISYSSKDQSFAERLHADLQNKGVRCWFAPEDLKIGDHFRDRIDESIRLHDKLLIILSENSVASRWVSDEVESAIEREHREGRTVLFPIKIDDAVMESKQAWAATIRRTRHIGDFTRWKDHDSYQKAFERLLRDLKDEEDKKSRSDAASSALFDRAVSSPRNTFREEWEQVESSIVKSAKRYGLINEENIEASQVINKLFEAGIISEAIKEKFYSLKKWHHNVVFWGASSSVEPQSAIDFVNMAKDLQKAIETAWANNREHG